MIIKNYLKKNNDNHFSFKMSKTNNFKDLLEYNNQ